MCLILDVVFSVCSLPPFLFFLLFFKQHFLLLQLQTGAKHDVTLRRLLQCLLNFTVDVPIY